MAVSSNRRNPLLSAYQSFNQSRFSAEKPAPGQLNFTPRQGGFTPGQQTFAMGQLPTMGMGSPLTALSSAIIGTNLQMQRTPPPSPAARYGGFNTGSISPLMGMGTPASGAMFGAGNAVPRLPVRRPSADITDFNFQSQLEQDLNAVLQSARDNQNTRFQRNSDLFNERWANRNAIAQTNENWSHSPLSNFAGQPGGVPSVTEQDIAGFNAQAPMRYGQGGSTGAGMLDRADYFAGAGAMNQNMLQRQAAGEGVVMQPGGYGSPLMFAERQMSEQDALDQATQRMQEGMQGSQTFAEDYQGPFTRSPSSRRLGSPFRPGETAYTSREQALRDLGNTVEADKIAKDREARMEEVKRRRRELGLPVGPGERREAREAERRQNLIRGQRQNAIRRGIDPSSSQAAGLFPELYQDTQETKRQSRIGGSPLSQQGDGFVTSADGAVSVPLVPQDAPKTPGNMQQANQAVAVLLGSRPLFAAAGVLPAEDGSLPTPNDFVDAMNSYFSDNPAVDPDEKDLLAMHQAATQFAKNSETDKPFGGTLFGSRHNEELSFLWDDFSKIDIKDDKARREWFSKYRRALQPPVREPNWGGLQQMM